MNLDDYPRAYVDGVRVVPRPPDLPYIPQLSSSRVRCQGCDGRPNNGSCAACHGEGWVSFDDLPEQRAAWRMLRFDRRARKALRVFAKALSYVCAYFAGMSWLMLPVFLIEARYGGRMALMVGLPWIGFWLIAGFAIVVAWDGDERATTDGGDDIRPRPGRR